MSRDQTERAAADGRARFKSAAQPELLAAELLAAERDRLDARSLTDTFTLPLPNRATACTSTGGCSHLTAALSSTCIRCWTPRRAKERSSRERA